MKTLLILFMSLSFSSTICWAEVLISEETLLQRIERSNDLVLAGQQKVEAFEEYKGALGRSFLPKASIFAAQEHFEYAGEAFQDQPYYGAKLEVNLYNGGRDRVRSDIAEVQHTQQQSELKIVKFKQLEKARKTMWRALYLKELIAQYEQAQKLIERNRKSALKRIRSGVATKSDQFEFEIKSSELLQDLKTARLAFEKEKGLLKVLLGIEPQKTIRLAEDFTHDHNWREYIAHSEKDHDYLLEPQQWEVAKTSLKSELGAKQWLPKLDIYAWWQQFNRRQDFDRVNSSQRQLTNLGLQLKWDFADFIEGNVQRKAESTLAEANSLTLNYQKRELENELHLELRELELLDGMVHVADDNIQRSEKFFQLITNEYKRGVKTSGDMLMATEKLVSSKIRKMMIVRDFHIAKAHIKTKLGQ